MSVNFSGSKTAIFSSFSPKVINFTGIFSSLAMVRIIPPFEVPSVFVRTIPLAEQIRK